MKILVCIKHVPDTETKIKLTADGRLDESGIKWIISPFDEYALEQALLVRESRGTGEVVLTCAGREASRATLRQGLALGADRAVLILDERFERCDALVRARALAATVKAEGAELVLLGKYGVGTDEWQTAPMLAEVLGWPHVSAVCRFELDGESITAAREVEGAVEVHETRLPAVISCEKGLNEPRYASLTGIMKAKKKPVTEKSAADLGLGADQVGVAGSGTRQTRVMTLPERGECKFIEGDAREAARKLVQVLRNEAKVI